jgi:hypothetical protein
MVQDLSRLAFEDSHGKPLATLSAFGSTQGLVCSMLLLLLAGAVSWCQYQFLRAPDSRTDKHRTLEADISADPTIARSRRRSLSQQWDEPPPSATSSSADSAAAEVRTDQPQTIILPMFCMVINVGCYRRCGLASSLAPPIAGARILAQHTDIPTPCY